VIIIIRISVLQCVPKIRRSCYCNWHERDDLWRKWDETWTHVNDNWFNTVTVDIIGSCELVKCVTVSHVNRVVSNLHAHDNMVQYENKKSYNQLNKNCLWTVGTKVWHVDSWYLTTDFIQVDKLTMTAVKAVRSVDYWTCCNCRG